MTLSKVIAIDGPSGSGKSTIARKLSQHLGVLYVDTGAMYRSLGYICKKYNIPFVDNEELGSFLAGLDFKYMGTPEKLLEINGEDLTAIIREHHVSSLASSISQLPRVRDYLVDFQRQLAQKIICVMEGRDIGTVVFPNAFCKIYLTAGLEIRAQRRLEQLIQQGHTGHTFGEMLADVKKRDERDSQRKIAPLKQAEGALLLDAGEKSIDTVLAEISAYARAKGQPLGIKI